ncbi:MAG TPA: hypothetical protein VEW95_07825 [Candidatus Limnocylindrales bacterium]|nr:hypothetical protein [Candidatus Limnocylindrales bacterium]
MHRPKLILRRHGAMTFGLGYFEDGVWVDHLVADDPGVREAVEAQDPEGDAALMDVVHESFSCCADRVALEIPVAEPAGAVPTFGLNLQAVAGTAER